MEEDNVTKALFDQIEEACAPNENGWPNKLLLLIAQAQSLGIYPMDTVPANPNSVLSMVKGYGARWIYFRGLLECPHCKADLRAPEGPPFKREIGMVENDRCTHFICPDCKQRL